MTSASSLQSFQADYRIPLGGPMLPNGMLLNGMLLNGKQASCCWQAGSMLSSRRVSTKHGVFTKLGSTNSIRAVRLNQ